MELYNIKKVVGALNPVTTRLNNLTKTEAFMYCYNSKRLEPLCSLYITSHNVITGTEKQFVFLYNINHEKCNFMKVEVDKAYE